VDIKKLLIIVAAVIIIAAYFFFDLGQYINLVYLKGSQERFRILYGEHEVAVYMAVALNGGVKLLRLLTAVHRDPTVGEINKKVAANFFSQKIFLTR
jgi:hypothetical protein